MASAIKDETTASDDFPHDLTSAYETLHHDPSVEEVESCLVHLASSFQRLLIPAPISTRIYATLVRKTLPDFWDIIQDATSAYARDALIRILRSVPGISALLSQIRLSSKEARASKELTYRLSLYVDLLALTLEQETITDQIQKDIDGSNGSEIQRVLAWKEYLKIVPSGIITSAVAEAEDVLKKIGGIHRDTWLANGSLFANWLGLNVVAMVCRESDREDMQWQASTQFFSKSLSFGYKENIMATLIDKLIIDDQQYLPTFRRLLLGTKHHEQAKAVDSIMLVLSQRYLPMESRVDVKDSFNSPKALGGAIKLTKELLMHDEELKQHLSNILTSSSRSAGLASPACRRVIISALSEDKGLLQEVLEKCWSQFSNNLFIQHASVPEQQAMAQTLLLSAGYVHRSQPMALFMMAKSSKHTQGTSQRLANMNSRTRLLGMLVAMAVSDLVDKGETKLKFDGVEMQTADAKWYLSLTKVDDQIGSISSLKSTSRGNDKISLAVRPKANESSSKGQTTAQRTPSTQKIPNPVTNNPTLDASYSAPSSLRIMERPSDSEEDINTLSAPSNAGAQSSNLKIIELDAPSTALKPYAKPDSDPEDDSPDPTLVNRNKPKPPVYIRNLLKELTNTEDIERRTLALRTAPALIRRKANFGREVSDNVEDLATALANLNNSDDFDVEEESEFLELRARALRAVLVASPERMGKWFGEAVVRGEYSIQQKLGILVAVGLAGREIAGFEQDEFANEDLQFPSKRLKGKMEQVWAGDDNRKNDAKRLSDAKPSKLLKATKMAGTPIDNIAVRLSRTLLEPMALSAADEIIGPDVLKVKKLSTRLDVEKKRKKPAANRLSAIIADSFFFPLLGGFGGNIQISSNRASAPSSPHILPTYLRTLTLLLHAAGPSCPSLPQLTTDYWPILLSLRSLTIANPPTLEAILFSLLTLLELNAEHQDRIVQQHAKLLLETQEWARLVVENADGVGEEAERIKMLAAGIVVRCGEIVEKFRRSLVGDMIDF